LRGRIGSFADQVYPACALSAFAKAFNNPQAKGMAVRTAQAICDRQGPLGQWWWHYDSASGSVVIHHPVYSVQQHAMGPMALIAVEDVSGKDFHKQILGGVEWITGRNELSLDMRDDSHHVIWRSFFQSSQTKYSNALLSMVGLPSSPKGL